jgi:H+/Cl- antiporter ClcA
LNEEALLFGKDVIKSKRFWKNVSASHAIRLNIVFWGGGILVGFASVLMTYASTKSEHFFTHYILSHTYLPLMTTPFIFLLITLAIRLCCPMAAGSGVPQVIAALKTQEYSFFLGLRSILGKFLLLIALMFGAVVGREGPIVQIGAGLMLALYPLIKHEKYNLRPLLVMAGGAAGIAAAFAAPLGGIMFAIECLIRRFEIRITTIFLGTVALSSIVGYFILGHYAYFGKASANLTNMQGWLAIVVCGILGGLLGGIFTVVFVSIVRAVRNFRLLPAAIMSLFFGFIVVGLGYLSHGQIYGSGYHQAAQIIAGHQYPASFAFYKMLGAIFSVASGQPGGIFAPALTAGAGLGQIFSHWFTHVQPDAMVIVGMATFFCGITRLPITTFAIVIEITHTPNLIIPLIVATLIANIFANFVSKRPFYDALAEILCLPHTSNHKLRDL